MIQKDAILFKIQYLILGGITMLEQEISLIELLEQRKLWLQDEIRQTDIALSALKSESLSPKRGRLSTTPTAIKMKWAPKIDELFKNYDEELTLHAIFDKLGELGMDEAKNKLHRASINACLSRRVKQGKLYRVRPGVYRRKQSDEVPDSGTSS